MKFSKLFVAVVLFGSTAGLEADLFDDLSQLKNICDADLLTAEECSSRRTKILAKYDGETDNWYCNYAGESAVPKEFTVVDEKSFSESASASAVVKEILDEAGLAPNFVVRPASVPNAAASARAGQRFIEYNPAFISQLRDGAQTNWAVYSVMAHEIGHHLQGHTLQAGGSRPAIELEADEYSGFILARLGASLPQAQKAMSTFGSDASAGTHPATSSRLSAIKSGWDKAGSTPTVDTSDSDSTTTPTAPSTSSPPGPTLPMPTSTYTDSCIVNGEHVVIAANGAVLSQARGYLQVGQKVPAASPNCFFDMLSNGGRYCVTRSGSVHFGSPVPVGQCQPCVGNICS